MEGLPVIFALLSLTVPAIFAGNVTINVSPTPSPTPFDAGQVVVITCTSRGAGQFDVIELRAQTPAGPVNVVTNQEVNERYRNRKLADGSNRYRSTFAYNQDTKVMTVEVNIDGAQAEDSGKFFCVLVEENNINSEEITIAIKTPVISVSLGAVHPNGTVEIVPDGSLVNFTYGTQNGVACVASIASYVIEPAVNVTVNGVNATHVGLVSGGNVKPVVGQSMVYEYTYKFVTSEPNYILDNSVIRCRSFAQGFESEVKNAEVMGSATYKPVILCDNIKPRAAVSGDGSVSCTVVANPPVSRIQVNYGLLVTDNERLFELGTSKYGKYTLQRQDNGKNSTISFTISGMTDAMFKQYTYQITAISSVGESKQSFSFLQGVVSASSRWHFSCFLIPVVSAMHFFTTGGATVL